MTRPAEVFLSHASADRATADLVAALLERHGVPHWYSRRSIRGAQQWHDEIGRALARCDWFVLLLSETSVKSKWVKRELLYALDDDRYQDHILPLVLDDCDYRDLSWTLKSFEMVDMREPDALRRIVETWAIGFIP